MGMALCIFLICVLQTVLDAMDRRISTRRVDRLATRHAVSSGVQHAERLPIANRGGPCCRWSPR